MARRGKSKLVAVEEILRTSHNRLLSTAFTLSRVFSAWESVAKSGVERETWPVGFSGGCLTIGSENPTLAYHLGLQATRYLPALEEILGDGRVRKLRFVTAPRP